MSHTPVAAVSTDVTPGLSRLPYSQ